MMSVTDMACKYQYLTRDSFGMPIRRERNCDEKVYGKSPYCILHIEFPDKDSPEYDKVVREKDAKVQEKLKNGEFHFEGTKIDTINLVGREDIHGLNFCDATIRETVFFANATICGNALFTNVTIGNALFSNVTIYGNALFQDATLKGANFDNATITGDAWFYKATIGGAFASFKGVKITGWGLFTEARTDGHAIFTGATVEAKSKGIEGKGVAFLDAVIRGNVKFDNATINGDVGFDGVEIKGSADFNGVTIEGDASFQGVKIRKELNFRDSQGKFTGKFTQLKAEENACRAAKQNCEQRGAREDADYYYYREMAARRKQRPERFLPRLKNHLEWLVQYPLGYGAYPRRLLLTWFVVAFASAFSLAWASGRLEDAPFGFVAAFIPGFAIRESHPIPNIYAWVVVGTEAIFGAFLWAAFILVFARKYMR